MEPVEVQNIVNQENKETKTFSLHPAIFVIIFLIIYGTQVFNLDLVISGILLLIIISYILYKVVEYIEKLLLRI